MINLAIERKFIADNIKKLQVKEYLEKELERAGCGEIDIQRTPLGTRVMVFAQRPGLVIGKKGTSIKKLTDVLEKEFKIDNPQVEVNELGVPELNAQIMAENIASALERGIHFRRAAYTTLRRIMEAGARGAQIEISGKLTGERAKTVKFTDGYLKHCGEPAILYVKKGYARASPKPGIIGVKVKIMPPGIKLPDEIEFKGIEPRGERKAEPAKLEELVEVIEEELEAIDEEAVAVPKKIKPEKVKRKKRKTPIAAEIEALDEKVEPEEAVEPTETPATQVTAETPIVPAQDEKPVIQEPKQEKLKKKRVPKAEVKEDGDTKK